MHNAQFRNITAILAVIFCLSMPFAVLADTSNTIKETEFVAKVNGIGISGKDFNRSIEAAEKQFASIGNQQGNSTVNVKKEVLDRLIDFELMLQDGKKRGITVDEKQVEKNLTAFSGQFEKQEDFTQYLENNDITVAEMKEQMRRSLVMPQLQEALRQELTAAIHVSDQETKEFYDGNIDKFKRPEQVRASHILISVDPKADEETALKARKELEAIQKKIKDGADFGEMAKTSSGCPSSAQGGDLGFFGKGQMVKPFEDTAFALKLGEMSDIVETQFGYHLIQMKEKKEAGMVPFEEVQERISQYLSQLQLDKAQQDYVKAQREKAQISILIELD
jgi:peptidyl-prolyl cis-trans isomerase C